MVKPLTAFNQPLYRKARKIVLDVPCNSRQKEIVILLLDFHVLMMLLEGGRA